MNIAVSKPPLTIRLCGPRGFCAGVDRAIQIVVLALKSYGAPVYVRHEIVHNRYVVEGLEAKGAVFVEELNEIPEEHRAQPVVFSAHGVPKSVPEDATTRNLFYLDATCPLVSKVHKQAMRHNKLGRHVVLIGHAGHPEVIGTMGQLPEGRCRWSRPSRMSMSTSPSIPTISATSRRRRCRSTTPPASSPACRSAFPNLTAPAADSICYATTNRQEVVKQAAPGCDLFIIVGAPNSSNSKRLVEVALRAGAKKSILVQRASELDWDDIGVIGRSACRPAPRRPKSSSTRSSKPSAPVRGEVELAETVQENEHFLVNRELRSIELTTADMAFVNG
jgi:4-hydroxy-3-methylbut-2-enyl diphosphate reductase